MKTDNLFETSNLPLAASIICLGISLDSVDKGQEGSKAIFIFDRSNNPDLDQIIQEFWQKSLRIEPNSLLEAVRFLKGRLYGGTDG